MSSQPHPLVQLARRAIEAYVREGRSLAPPPRAEWAPEMFESAGVFVSIHEQSDLRGCIGTFMPACKNVAEEIIENAISAATRDPRFLPIEPSELDALEISVDVLSPPEPINSLAQLDAVKYGVIVTDLRGARRGLLLPNLAQVTTPADQVAIAKQKAFIAENEPIKLYRFEVRRYH